jgi:galactofuranose transport system permease protein
VKRFLKRVFTNRLMWPIGALVALILLNFFSRPSFLSVTVQNGQFYGSIIDILRNSAPLMLVALGMCLVIGTRGIDLSVGAQMAVSGAVALTIIADSPTPNSLTTVLVAILAGIGLTLIFGLWNGFLVSVVGIQPIIATLVLMLAGRGIALLITNGFITTINSTPYAVISGGYIFGFPFEFFVSLGAIIVISLVVRRTALGVLTESVGINPSASRLAGVRSRGIVWALYGLSGLLAGIAGILYSSNIMAADSNAAGLYIELDAILAVVLGGTSLAGGKFTLAGTVVGVFTIQTLTSTITFLGVPSAATPLFKAIVVIIVVLSQSRLVRQGLRNLRPPGRPKRLPGSDISKAAASAERTAS